MAAAGLRVLLSSFPGVRCVLTEATYSPYTSPSYTRIEQLLLQCASCNYSSRPPHLESLIHWRGQKRNSCSLHAQKAPQCLPTPLLGRLGGGWRISRTKPFQPRPEARIRNTRLIGCPSFTRTSWGLQRVSGAFSRSCVADRPSALMQYRPMS
jgi:hypothetical protein